MTDPTITIAGLEARIGVLSEALRLANRGRADLSTDASKLEARLGAMEAERDALAAQLAEVRAQLHEARHVGTDLGVANDLCASLRADLASERAHLAACRIRIAGLEQAANERSADVARLTTRVAELEARPVLDVGRLAAALNQCELGPRASDIMRHLGPVTLPPAQDRAEELIAAYCDEFAARYEAEGNPPHMDRWHEVSAERRKFSIETMAATLAKLGAAPTAAPVDRAAAERVVREYHDSVRSPTCPASELGTGEWNRAVDAMSDALASLGAPPTSQPATRPVFAGVSVQELADVIDETFDKHDDLSLTERLRRSAENILARLDATLVAPVDPEAVAAAILAAVGGSSEAPAKEWKAATNACRATLAAAGIPVTPEVGK